MGSVCRTRCHSRVVTLTFEYTMDEEAEEPSAGTVTTANKQVLTSAQ